MNSYEEHPVIGEMRLKEDPLMYPYEVARIFRVNPKTITRWAATGQLPHIRTVGGHRRFRRSDVLALLQRKG